MTTITFVRFPTPTDRYRERLFRAIVNQPGIGLSRLAAAVQSIDSDQRRRLLAELVAADRVAERMQPDKKGRLRQSYWPAEPNADEPPDGSSAPSVSAQSPQMASVDTLAV